MRFKRIALKLAFLLLLTGTAGNAFCAVPENPDEDFVIASVMIASPGEELYSKLGHAFLRMQCPSHGMDFCFTYESEDAANKVMSFLSGKLRMGMQGIRTEKFLQHYLEEGRGVTQYDLRLPVSVKQNMWRILDGLVAEGMDLPYDYMERGCAYSVFRVICEALGERRMTISDWPADFDMTRREIVCSRLDDSPWTRLFLNIITNGPIDDHVAYTEKTITPEMLVLALQNTTVDGQPLISEGQTVAEAVGAPSEAGWLSPLRLSVMLLVLTAGCIAFGKNWMLYPLLGLQTLLGIFVCYLLFFSSLCATEWSWLVIPFNPLPLVFWKWRGSWELPWAIVIAGWCLCITLGGSYLMDPPIVLLALAFALSLAGDGFCRRGVSLRGRLEKLIEKRNTEKTNFKPV